MDVNNCYTQEEICEICEKYILCCRHSTSTFLCEGCCCEDAANYILDDDPYDRLTSYFRKEKILKLKDKIKCLKLVM